MGHINRDTLEMFKNIHHDVHHLLKRYYEDQTVTDGELVDELESIKSVCATMIENWKYYLGQK